MSTKNKLSKYIKYAADKKKPYSYRIYVGVDERTGTTLHRQKSFATYDEALESLVELKKSLKNKTFLVTDKRYKMCDLIELWLPRYKKTVKQSTYASIKQIIDKHIIPCLGNYYLDKLSVMKCQKVVEKWYKECPVSYNKIYAYARKIIDFGWRLELVASNPMAKVIKPRKKRTTDQFDNYYSKVELIQFLEACKQMDNQMYYTYFRLLAYTGLRASEGLALRWSDINQFNATLKVQRSVDTKEHNKIVIDTPKTITSCRTIDLDKGTLDTLIEWYHQNKIVNVKNKDGYIFFNPRRPEGVFTRQDARRWDYEIATSHNLRYITPHGFRHTHASMLFAAGVDSKDIQERLGHSSNKTTMDMYVHLGEKQKKQSANKFAEFMAN